MSTQSENIRAQKMAFEHTPVQPWHRHLIGPAELEGLFFADSENRQRGVILATLCDMVLSEDAADRSDEALLRAVRSLMRFKGCVQTRDFTAT